MVDKSNIDSGLVRIGFKEPELDVVILCSNPAELKVFIETTEVVQHLTPLTCEWNMQSRCRSRVCYPTYSKNCISCSVNDSPNVRVSNIPLLILYDNSRTPSSNHGYYRCCSASLHSV